MTDTVPLSDLGYDFDGIFGNVTLTSTDGGYIRIQPSTGDNGAAGPIQLLSADSGVPGGSGADIVLQSGAGFEGGNGGPVHIYGGTGTTDGVGDDGNGGDIRLSPGPGSGGTSRDGVVILDTAVLPSADPGIAGAVFTIGAPSAGVPKALMISGG